MRTLWIGLASALSGAIALAMTLPAPAQADSTSTITAPDYGSDTGSGTLSNGNFNTPESDGRPGLKFFTLGVQAFGQGDYRHAIDMYKVAASWAYKPAEYNLGVMYFKGQGVPVDWPRGAAWMVLAAERGEPQYVKARDLMVTVLSKAEFERTDEIWGELKNAYGDEVALRRAKAQWKWVANQATGSHLGHGMGNLRVGALDEGHSPKPAVQAVNAFGLMRGGSVDGSVAYRQFQQSDDPYSPVFLKHHTGTVTVEPLQKVHAGGRAATPASGASSGTNLQR